MLPKLSKMKFSKNGNVLNNKIVLYVVLIIAILNILGYLMNKNLEAVAFFVVIGFLTTYFTPNMIIVLAVAIARRYLRNVQKKDVSSVVIAAQGESDSLS